ncbi:hypothetical protein DMENIID0001_014950 [Sergentomyia squamirostris]
MRIFFLILFQVLCTSLTVIGSPSRPEVCAKDGCIQGVVESGRLKPYEAFYGIPFAEPPVGKLRFENPVSHSGWSGYWNASYYRGDCFQKNYFIPGIPLSGSEDCLHLNIYRPQDWKSKGKLPVFVWIHGGAFLSFSSDPKILGPDYLMDNGEVIFVTLNYRLGFFGFLCSGDGAVKGNFGLKDQQLALEWVARNIESFGGDSNSITLGGSSSGGVATNLQMINPKSQALFHRVMMSSGNALVPFQYPIDFQAQMRTLAKISGLKDSDTATTQSLASQLKDLPALTLVNAIDSLFVFALTPVSPVRFCIEGDWDGAFLTEDPRKVWAEGSFEQKPILSGTTAHEGIFAGLIVVNKTLRQHFNANINALLPIQMDMKPSWTGEVLKHYLGDKDYIDETNENDYLRMFGDRMFHYPSFELILEYIQYADVQKNPVFVYEFAYEGKYTFFKYLAGSDEHRGVSHLDDIIYLISMPGLIPTLEPETLDGKMSDLFVKTVVNFAKTGRISEWKPCTLVLLEPFCDYQIFNKTTDSKEVAVPSSNTVNKEMMLLWLKVDRDVEYMDPDEFDEDQ